jgi:DNA-binding response OmpR family regulator
MVTRAKRILLIEDDPLIIEIYTTQLKKAGFEVESAPDGEKALEMIKEKNFDLLILDIVLPYLTGFELLKRIRNQPEFKNLRVLVLSNLGQKSDIERAKRLGASQYLIKAHYTPSEVVEEIKKVLK